MLANLIDSFSHVQQLLVTLLFLLGISDSSKPIRHLTFRCANLFADAEPALQTARIKADNDSLICFIGRHLGAVPRRDRLRTRRHNCVSRMPN